MCGNPRKYWKERTPQEQLADLELKEVWQRGRAIDGTAVR
jgi:hypothetical protein